MSEPLSKENIAKLVAARVAEIEVSMAEEKQRGLSAWIMPIL